MNTDPFLPLDRAISELTAHKDAWAVTSIDERMQLLHEVRTGVMAQAGAWAAAAAAQKGIAPQSPLAGEEWISGPYGVLMWCNAMLATLAHIKAGTHLAGLATRSLPNGQLAARVMPASLYDRMLLSGVSAEVWMAPGVTAANLGEHSAAAYRAPRPAGKVALVLGAGNIAAIAPLDCLHKLYAEHEVVLLKMNPVNAYLMAFLAPALAPLIARGFLRIVSGDAAVGQYLCNHAGIDTIHITGSGAAHDAIVWGAGALGAANKLAGTPNNRRPISSELGGASPTIVVPGPWSEADLRFQAEHVATQKMHNAGFNCIASQVLITDAGWPQTQRFVTLIGDVLAAASPRALYYPGSAQRLDGLTGASANPRERAGAIVPFAAGTGHWAEKVEVFGPLLGHTSLSAASAEAFLIAAIAYANDSLPGTLGANILIHPATMAQIGRARFDAIIATLRYGTIAINAWTGLGFLLPACTWGAFPGHRLDDVQSGIGQVHNALLFDRAERSVIEAPFRPFPRALLSGQFTMLPRPPWFITNRRARQLGEQLTRFEFRRSPAKLFGIFVNALRG